MLTKFQARKRANAYRRTTVRYIPLMDAWSTQPSTHPHAGKWVELDYAGSVLSYKGKKMVGNTKAQVEGLRKWRLSHQRDAQESARVAGNWSWLHRWNPAAGILNSAQAVAV